MTRGRRTNLAIDLTPEERKTLESWQRSTTIQAGRARRGRIILMLSDGISVTEIAYAVGIRRRFVYKWAKRFTELGVPGLTDKQGRGRPPEPECEGLWQPGNSKDLAML
ncbi:MAG: helix-turn-helix domain-containing protein [SAR202 cluster bacterium]|nr:helix-turn-helix domain-containing protein [SAR202 cluster bacterium]